MNLEFFVKTTRWILYGAIGVLLVSVFFVFFGSGGSRGAIGKSGGVSTAGSGMMNIDRASESGGTVSVGMPNAEPAPVPEERMMAEDVVASSGAAPSASGVSPIDVEKRVVKNGNLAIRVEDAEWSADEIDRIATRLGGFTASRSFSSDIPGYSIPMLPGSAYDKGTSVSPASMPQSGMIVVKVPSSKFGEAISAIRGIATVVLNESSSASDVTAQFADLEARLKSKYDEEAAFTKILNTTTGKVSDILEVTRELSRVRGEIEQLETQKKYMESQTDMAEISVSLTEDASVGAATNTWRPWQTVKTAVNRLMAQFQGFVDGTIYFVVSILPFFLLYLLGLYVLYRIGRRVYLKMRGQ